jgi:hypothetical protein
MPRLAVHVSGPCCIPVFMISSIKNSTKDSYCSVINSVILDPSRKPLRSSRTSLEVSVGLIPHCLRNSRAGFNKSVKYARVARTGEENKGPPLVLCLCTGRWTVQGYSKTDHGHRSKP